MVIVVGVVVVIAVEGALVVVMALVGLAVVVVVVVALPPLLSFADLGKRAILSFSLIVVKGGEG